MVRHKKVSVVDFELNFGRQEKSITKPEKGGGSFGYIYEVGGIRSSEHNSIVGEFMDVYTYAGYDSLTRTACKDNSTI